MFYLSDEKNIDNVIENSFDDENNPTNNIELDNKKTNKRQSPSKFIPKKYVVTSVQYNGKANEQFFKGLEKYCEEKNAELLINPIRGANIEEDELDPLFENYKIINGDMRLNRKIGIKKFDIRPNQINPLTGLERFVQDDTTAIIASPKIAMKVVANSKRKIPKILMTTGAATFPNYPDKHRINYIARRDHSYGAVVVETINSNRYHFRSLNSLKNGVFYDLCEKFNGSNAPEFERPPVLVLGDWHSGDTDPSVREETYKMLEKYEPKRIFVHDVFNGHSINHWNRGKIIDLYKNKHRLNLQEEIELVAHDLEEMAKRSPNSQIFVVKSNHDERLYNYLNQAEYARETHPYNLEIALELALEVLNGNDPLEAGVRKYAKNLKNVKFLGLDEDYKILGWQLANHGHLGSNGGKGSKWAIEKANGKSITMHSHTPEAFRNMYKGGTSTLMDLDYNKGYSGWMNTHVFLYGNGKPQLVNIIDGEHRSSIDYSTQ